MEKTTVDDTISKEEPKKQRGRRKKSVLEPVVIDEPPANIQIVIEETTDAPPVAKKRGRKPKGGKLVLKNADPIIAKPAITNVILHLKCSLTDLTDYTDKMSRLFTDPLSYNPTIPPDIMTYNDTHNLLKYESISQTETQPNPEVQPAAPTNFAYLYENAKTTLCTKCNQSCAENEQSSNANDDDMVNVKDMNAKLKKLKIQYFKNTLSDKKSACFWCTYDFDNPACHIPKYVMDDQIHGYGSFCRPECAAAYLMRENIDDSMKFERYHLLNQIYSKVYDYKKNIKPAPNPYYLLEKYYGNLSIQEYRKLLKTEHMMLVIEKPMTRILPELHEDNEEMVLNVSGTTKTQNTTGMYKVKRESEKQKGPTKTSIMKEKFGLA
jgi:hypothetical protein